MGNIDIEIVCASVHKAYCDNRITQGKEPYWTKGDYNLLDEAAKGIDRATVFAVLEAVKFDELQAENEELIRQVSIHRKGECIEAFCFECNKYYYYVDDEVITCPCCNK